MTASCSSSLALDGGRPVCAARTGALAVVGGLAVLGALLLVPSASPAKPAEAGDSPTGDGDGGGGGQSGTPAAGPEEPERVPEPAPERPAAEHEGESAKPSNSSEPLPELDLDARDAADPARRSAAKGPTAAELAEGAEARSAAGTAPIYDLGTANVLGQRRQEATTVARYELRVGKLGIIPQKDVSKQLMLAPGVLTVNHGGEGHAHETYMRGFAAGDGKDIEFTMGGVPLNEVSNPHGHGYADLFFMPPELVRAVTVTEGPFDPVQGDFAFAGSADYQLGVPERGSRVKYGFGRWNTHRALLLYAPAAEPDETFGAFELFRTDGFGPNRAASRAVGIGRYASDDRDAEWRWGLTAVAQASRFDQAGVVREDDYDAGRMGFFDTYDPNQGGESNRLLLSFDTALGPPDGRMEQVTFLGYRTLRMRANFTGWMTDSEVASGAVAGVDEQRGDGVEMRYDVLTGGSRGQYSMAGRLFGEEQRLTLGYAARFDHGRSEQLRVRSVTAIPYARVFDRDFTVVNTAGWVRANIRPCPWLSLGGGVRLDGFGFGVTDLNQPTADREGPREPDQTSQSFGFAVNPRVATDVALYEGLHLIASYGMGTRSTEAAALSDNENAPFARAHVADGGLGYDFGALGDPFALHAQLSYSFAHVDKDLLFSETAGRNVLVGASSRHAVTGTARAYFGSWFDALLNVGWAYATLDETDELLPYIPQWVVRLDAAASSPLFDWHLGDVPVTGRAGVGLTFVPGRPLPRKQVGDDMFLANLGAELRLWHTSVGVEIRNLFNLEYRQAEMYYASNFLGPRAAQSRVAERHFVAGEPFFVMGTITVHVEDAIRGLSEDAEPREPAPADPLDSSAPAGAPAAPTERP